MSMDIQRFFLWEKASRDTIDFKKIYADITGDLLAGLMLSEIVYWHLPNKQGDSKLLVNHEGYYWIAVRRYEWWNRIRLSPKQADRALSILVEKQYIIKDVFKFDGDPTLHVRLNFDHFIGQLEHTLNNPISNPFLPEGKSDIPQRVKTELTFGEIPVTETTTEIDENARVVTNMDVDDDTSELVRLYEETFGVVNIQHFQDFKELLRQHGMIRLKAACVVTKEKGGSTPAYTAKVLENNTSLSVVKKDEPILPRKPPIREVPKDLQPAFQPTPEDWAAAKEYIRREMEKGK